MSPPQSSKINVSETIYDRPNVGTYQVNPDCTIVIHLLLPGPPFVIEERGITVDRGNEIRAIVTEPPLLMLSSVQRRVHSK